LQQHSFGSVVEKSSKDTESDYHMKKPLFPNKTYPLLLIYNMIQVVKIGLKT